MKILQFGKFYYPTFGGMERAMFEIVEGLNDNGVVCDVLCSNTSKKNEISDFGKYKVHRTASYGIVNSTSITPNLIFKLKKMCNEYDVIDAHHPDPMAFLALFLVRPRAKIVIHWQSDIVRQKLMGKLFMPLQNWVLRRADRIILASHAYAEHSTDLKDFQQKIAVVPIGIDATRLKIDQAKYQEIHKQYEDKKIIFALGRLVSYKGFDYLIKAAEYLDDNYIVLLAGKGSEEENLLSLIELHGVQDRVKMLGFITEEEKYAYYKASTLFCLPSVTKAEAFGVVLVEAMVFSKPSVVSNIAGSGMNWVCKDGVTGIKVEPRNSKALADAILQITTDSEQYDKFASHAKKRYEEIFTREKMVDKLKSLYSRLIQEQKEYE